MTNHSDSYERAGKKEKKVSKQFGKKTEITNEKVKMDAQLKERNACRKVGREYVKEE